MTFYPNILRPKQQAVLGKLAVSKNPRWEAAKEKIRQEVKKYLEGVQ